MIKKFFVTFSVLALILLNGCSTSHNWASLVVENVNEVKISGSPKELFEAITTKDSEQISKIINYINLLKKVEQKQTSLTYGGGYQIEVIQNDDTKRTIYINGNSVLVENSLSYQIPYNEAIKFDGIIGEYLISRELENNKLIVKGIVLTKKKGVCSIQSEDGRIKDINISNSFIFDTRGKGNLEVFKGNRVIIFGTDDVKRVYIN